MARQPEWLDQLAKLVCDCMDLSDEAPPIGCHYHFNGELWEVSLFILSTEVVGGAYDGVKLSALFFLDLSRLLDIFDVVESSEWQPHRIDESDDLGSHVALIGRFQGRRIWLRILADSPEQFVPGRRANLLNKTLSDLWST